MRDPRSTHRVSALLIAFALGSSIGLPAFAQAPPDKGAIASVLFSQAMALAAQGKFAEACPKFEESQRTEPSLGTQYYLADCYEHVGKTASAWFAFREVASKAKLAGESAKESKALDRATALEPKLSLLTLTVAAKVTGLEVRRGSTLVPEDQWGVANPADPGSYELTAKAPGKKPWSKTIVLTPESALAETIPALEDEPLAAQVPAEATGTASSASTQKTIAIVVGSVGLLALGGATVFGLSAKSKLNESSSHCGGAIGAPDGRCDPQGIDLHHSAASKADVATALFIVSGVALATSGILWFTRPTEPEARPPATMAVGVGLGTLSFRAAF